MRHIRSKTKTRCLHHTLTQVLTLIQSLDELGRHRLSNWRFFNCIWIKSLISRFSFSVALRVVFICCGTARTKLCRRFWGHLLQHFTCYEEEDRAKLNADKNTTSMDCQKGPAIFRRCCCF